MSPHGALLERLDGRHGGPTGRADAGPQLRRIEPVGQQRGRPGEDGLHHRPRVRGGQALLDAALLERLRHECDDPRPAARQGRGDVEQGLVQLGHGAEHAEERRQIVDTERKLAYNEAHSVQMEQLAIVQKMILQIILEHVQDQGARKRIVEDFRRRIESGTVFDT